MWWTHLLALLVGILLGASAGTLIIIKAFSDKFSEMTHPDIVMQLVRCQEYLDSIPIKDDRVRKLMQDNQRVLVQAKEQIEDELGIDIPES